MHKPIMIVEDDRDIRESLKLLLNDENYEVFTASNGKEGLDFLRSEGNPRPGLIFLDLMMPVMDGKDFLKEFEKDSNLSSIPVVVLSAAKESFQNSIVGFMKKPLDIDEVIKTVEKYVK